MELKLNVNDVLPQLTSVASVIGNKNAIAILDKVLFEVNTQDNVLSLTGSDSNTWVTMKANLISSTQDLRFCILAKDVLQSLRNLQGFIVTLTLDESKKVVEFDYGKGKFMLPYEDADDYPKPNDLSDKNVKHFHLNPKDFLNTIEKTKFAMAKDEIRKAMCAICFDFFKDYVVAVASDGMKLVKYTNKNIKSEIEDETKQRLVLSSKPSTTLAMLLASTSFDNVSVAFDETNAVFVTDGFKVSTRLGEQRYPNYDAVIPQDNHLEIVLPKKDVVDALKRVLPLGSATTSLVVATLENNGITLRAEDSDFSKSASETLPCQYNDVKFTIGFKGSTLLEMVQNIEQDNVVLKFKEPSRAFIVKPQETSDLMEYTSILMPMLM